MRLHSGLLMLGLAACSQPSGESTDLGSGPVDQTLLSSPFAGASLKLIAGQPGGAGNADGTGADARFSSSYGIATDGVGNLYVADKGSSTIRKIVLATGAVTTIAGTAGIADNTDGTGAAARFSAPLGVAADGTGNVYVVDGANSTIRKIVLATGVVSTLAGTARSVGSTDGIGTAARFNQPQGVAFDGAGSLYVADRGSSTIRKIVLATGAVTTIAGSAGSAGSVDGTSSAARFDSPGGVAADSAGNLYVADTINHTIRMIVLATGTVTTIAGSAGASGGTDGTGAAARFNQPQAVLVDGAGSLYVADSGNNSVRKIALATGAVTTIAARLNTPQGLAWDGTGNLYVAELNGFSVRKIVLATSVVSTLAGAPSANGSVNGPAAAARFSQPYAAALDGTNLYVADTGIAAVRKIELMTGAVSTIANGGNFAPRGVAADGQGNLYVSSYNMIHKIVLAAGTMSPLAGSAGSIGSADGIGASASFKRPEGLAWDGAGELYVADSADHTIRRIVVATGAVTTLAGSAGLAGSTDGIGAAARFYAPIGLASDGAGRLYVADGSNHTIRKIVLSTGLVSTLAGTASLNGSADGIGPAARFDTPSGITLDGARRLYIADANNSVIRQLDLAGGGVTTIVGVAGQRGVKLGLLPGGLSRPTAVAMSATAGLIIVSNQENCILSVR